MLAERTGSAHDIQAKAPEVLTFVPLRLANSETTEALVFSPRTVESDVESLLLTTGAPNGCSASALVVGESPVSACSPKPRCRNHVPGQSARR